MQAGIYDRIAPNIIPHPRGTPPRNSHVTHIRYSYKIFVLFELYFYNKAIEYPSTIIRFFRNHFGIISSCRATNSIAGESESHPLHSTLSNQISSCRRSIPSIVTQEHPQSILKSSQNRRYITQNRRIVPNPRKKRRPPCRISSSLKKIFMKFLESFAN